MSRFSGVVLVSRWPGVTARLITFPSTVIHEGYPSNGTGGVRNQQILG